MDPIRGHVCRSCRLKLATPRPILQPRSFSTTTTLQIVPPESPYYVDIPSSYQAFSPYQPKQKGHLPTPREIFPANRPDKPSQAYLANVTADPLPKNIKPSHQLSTLGKHKAKMAEKRRQQLREGLTALHARKQADLANMSSRSQAKQRERENLLSQAEREDARLTNTSVPQAMKPINHAKLTIASLETQIANAKALHAEKRANYETAQQAKHSEKMDALHTLYMNARSFVTTEAQLNVLLKEQFDDKKRFQNDEGEGDSLWHLGAPVSVKDLIADAAGRPRARVMGSASGAVLSSLSGKDRFASGQRDVDEVVSRDQERLKKIAERLSGGKI